MAMRDLPCGLLLAALSPLPMARWLSVRAHRMLQGPVDDLLGIHQRTTDQETGVMIAKMAWGTCMGLFVWCILRFGV